MFRTVRSGKIYLEIIEQIKEMIESGLLKPGYKLPSEIELAKEFGTSRASVREALVALQTIGLIECRRGEGYFIRKGIDPLSFFSALHNLTMQLDLRDVKEARRSIEVGIIPLAILKGSMKEIAHLEALFGQLERVAEISDWNALVTEFHLTLTLMADNPLLMEIMHYLLERDDFKLTLMPSPEARKQVLDTYRELINSCKQRDPMKAMTLLIMI